MITKTFLAPSMSTTVPSNNYGKRIGILIVAYNAVTTLPKVFQRIPQDVWNNVEEVVVFDDSSHDHTYELALGYKEVSKIHHLNIYRNPQNLGYGGKQKIGYEYFISKGFDAVVLLHGDGQYAPEILAHLYHPIVSGESDAVFGSRMMMDYGGPIKGGMPLYKYVGNRILTFFENTILGMNLTEFHSGYRAYNLHALKKIDFSRMTNDFHFDTEIIVKLHHQGFHISEVPIPTYYGDEICYVNGMKYARDVFKSIVRYKQTVQSVRRYPEYEEYFVNYPIKQSKYSSHYFLRRLVGKGHEVLDIGCGEGFFASTIADNNYIVGIDYLEHPSNLGAFKKYFQADLENGLSDLQKGLDGVKFDRVLLPDVLEHLRFPERLLKDCYQTLRTNGLIIVSVPNVANITVRLALLLGRWNYTERGILDKTHYRFYTHFTMQKLLEENGYEIVKQLTTVMPIELVIGLPPSNPFMGFLTQILAFFTALMPGLLGYQCMFVARKKTK